MSESQEPQKETAAPAPEAADTAGTVAAKDDSKSEVAGSAAPVEVKAPSDEVKAPSDEVKAAPETRIAEPVEAPGHRRSLPSSLGLAAALAGALGIGWAAGHATSAMKQAPDPVGKALLAVDWNGMAAGLQKSQADAMRMAADIQALKGTLAGLKETADRSRQDAAGRFAQLAERLDRAHKADQEIATKLAALADRADKGDRDAKLASTIERPDRMERQAAAQVAKPAAVAAGSAEPLRTGSIPEASQEVPKPEQKTEAKPMPIEGWVLREVYDGLALIEGRNQRLHEVAPGQSLPGIGKVEAIEKRGRSWVVVTNRGIILSQPW
jgi:hypothetical protein